MKDVALEEVADAIDYGVTASAQTAPVGPKMLRITDVQDGAVDWSTVPHCSVRTKKADKARLRPGDIVFARTGATTGKSFLIRDCPEGSVFASYLIRVRLSDAADPRYVGHFFRSAGYWAQITTESRGAAQPGVNSSKLKALRVPLPPIEEQRRIAAVLDAADTLRAKRREALAKLDTLTQAIFIDMFGSGEWPTSRLGDEVDTTSGGTPSRRKPEFFDGNIPWVKSGEVAQGVVRDTEEHISAEAVASSSAKLMPPGTVLLAMYGATVGAVGELGVEATTNQAVCCITPSDTMSRPYLIGLLRSLKRELVAKGAGGAQPNISQTIIRDLRVPMPPVDVQAAYAARVRAVADATERVQKSESGLDTLFASLQQRAFRGEL